MGKSLITISDAQYTQELIGLQNQEFELEMKLLDVEDERKREFITSRLRQLKYMMETIEGNSTKAPEQT